jgi:hypothetical protein
MNRMRALLILVIFLSAGNSFAQMTDHVYQSNIKSVKLHTQGNQTGYPIIRLNSGDQLELHFDDMDADFKYYSYTFILCVGFPTHASALTVIHPLL